MEYNTNRIYIKNKVVAFALTIVMTILFIVGLSLQTFFVSSEVLILTSVMLVIFSLFYNLLLGIPGFVISLILNSIQLILYGYRYYVQNNTVNIYLFALASMSVIMVLSFNLFMRRVSDNIVSLREKIDEEQSRRISTERTAQIETAMNRQALITKHEDIDDAVTFTEAIDNSRAAHFDSLTTLPGREKIFEHIDNLINQNLTNNESTPIRIAYIVPNDRVSFLEDLGHRSTDLFIQCIAHRIRESANTADLVGRISRLEFVIVTKRDLSNEDYNHYIDSLIMAAEDSVMDENGSAHLKFYAGVSTFPGKYRFSGDILHEAEVIARSNIKTNSVSNTDYEAPSEPCELLSMDSSELEKIFDDAITNNEFYIVYQPQFDSNKKVVGFEAFVRWNNPKYENIDTIDFLVAAEKSNRIYDVGMFIIKKSLLKLSDINETYPDIKMALNMSSIQLQNSKTAEELDTLLSALNINRSNVIIDIPEESLLTNISSSHGAIEKLAESGVTMALDNFGRCYSSLNNIPLFPISIVKLDRNFTSDLKPGSHSRILTSSIIELLNEINVSVDATGVATEEQFEALTAFGCKYFQGRYLCKPLKDEELNNYIKENI